MKPFEVQTIIGCEATHVALQAAVDRATKEGVRINVAVVDAAGNLAEFLRMPAPHYIQLKLLLIRLIPLPAFRVLPAIGIKSWRRAQRVFVKALCNGRDLHLSAADCRYGSIGN